MHIRGQVPMREAGELDGIRDEKGPGSVPVSCAPGIGKTSGQLPFPDTFLSPEHIFRFRLRIKSQGPQE